MDESIIELGRDLAQAGYAKETQQQYGRVAEHLASRFGRPLAELTREQLRTYVEELAARGRSAQWLIIRLAAVKFLSQNARTAAFAPRVVFDALIEAAQSTLRALTQTRLQATVGATLVLHTWTRKLEFHPTSTPSSPPED